MARGRGRGRGRGGSASRKPQSTQSGKQKKEYLKQKKREKLEQKAAAIEREREEQYAKYHPPSVVVAGEAESATCTVEPNLVQRVNRHGEVNRLTTVFERQRDEDVLARKSVADITLDTTARGMPLTLPFLEQLGFPKRPKWKASDSVDVVNSREEKHFTEWLQSIYERARRGIQENNVGSLHVSDVLSPFEHNLEVWRQLWRVVERSDMLLLCADVRCASLHIPIEFYKYITSDLQKPMVIALTKIDLVSPMLVSKWIKYLSEKFPNASVVPFASKATTTNGTGGVATRRKLITKKSTKEDVEAMHASANNLIATCLKVYTEHVQVRKHKSGTDGAHGYSSDDAPSMLPNDNPLPTSLAYDSEVCASERSVLEKQGVDKVKNMPGMDVGSQESQEDCTIRCESGSELGEFGVDKTKCTAETNLGSQESEEVRAIGSENGSEVATDSKEVQISVDGTLDVAAHLAASTLDASSTNKDDNNAFRSSTKPDGVPTIGLVGQPNVGKSSLLNCLVGKHVVGVSRSCGHTKYLQTYLLKRPTNAASNTSLGNILEQSERLDVAMGTTGTQPADSEQRIVAELCDCPGLIFPVASFHQAQYPASNAPTVPSTIGLLPSPRAIFECSGLYPISQIREPYSAVRFLAERVELERFYNLKLDEEDYGSSWSPYALCGTLADKKGYKVSSGRGAPDFHRAGLEIIRDTVDGYVLLAFEPATLGS